MSSTSLISIIIPVWNEERYLAECLDTIGVQSYPHFECLLIDDGSTDATASIALSYQKKDPRFKYISKEHSGLIPSINCGFTNATGEVVCRMDGDDRMPANRLEKQLAELQKQGPRSLITGKVKYFSETIISDGYQKYEQWLNSLTRPDEFMQNAFIECPVAAPSWMMYTCDVKELNFFDAHIYPEDYNFMLKALMSGINFHSIPDTILEWREYPERTSRISDDYARERFWDVRARHLPQYIDKHTQYNTFVIWGVGSSGKALCKALHSHNTFSEGFIDTHPSRIGKKIINSPVVHYENRDYYANHFILIAVGQENAKPKIDQWMNSMGKQVGIDYLYCC